MVEQLKSGRREKLQGEQTLLSAADKWRRPAAGVESRGPLDPGGAAGEREKMLQGRLKQDRLLLESEDLLLLLYRSNLPTREMAGQVGILMGSWVSMFQWKNWPAAPFSLMMSAEAELPLNCVPISPKGMEAMNDYGTLDTELILNNPTPDFADLSLQFTHEPYLKIIEQPRQRGFRFRYSCEGPSHGGLQGVSSEKNKKTHPTVKVFNYIGPAKIVVQCVTVDDPPLLHVHSLVGKECTDGQCIVDVDSEEMVASFPNLVILHIPKRNVSEILEERLLEGWRRDLISWVEYEGTQLREPTAEEREKIRDAAEQQAKYMDLTVVRLMFTAYLPDNNGNFTYGLVPVLTSPIFDSNDIQVRFYEEDENGLIWEAFGKFGLSDVHKQVGSWRRNF
nr:PREDICTED: nuclear factor NF-kappa-B p105 subunit-like [Latimeria chalumnae]|eukprot:XP_014340151.1 PREDICTED: nuclear factor NF-kappa-B p105 subunit-like [Latimeria chalumnae]